MHDAVILDRNFADRYRRFMFFFYDDSDIFREICSVCIMRYLIVCGFLMRVIRCISFVICRCKS